MFTRAPLLTLLLAGGCATAPAAQRSPVTLDYALPVVDPTPDSKPDLEIDGVAVSVVPPRFASAVQKRTTVEELPTSIIINEQYRFKTTETPVMVVTPQALAFEIKIVNRLPHVLRLDGAALSVKIDGKRVSAEGGSALLAAVLAPGDTHEGKLELGAVHNLPHDATLAVDLFDVPTLTDEAGVVKKRTAFRWVFKLRHEPKKEKGQVVASEKYMTRADAALLQARAR